MKKKTNQIDLVKMLIYILKRLAIIVLCAELGFAVVYLYTTRYLPETYTATGTMYVSSSNPEFNEYQYTSSGDLSSVSQLIKTILVVVKRDTIMNEVARKISDSHPGVTAEYISSSLTLESVSETGVVAIISTTEEAQLSTDIVNAVLEIAPDEIIRVVGTGNISIMDYAPVPVLPNDQKEIIKGIKYGASLGALLGAAILALLYILNQKISDVQELKKKYSVPVLASVKRTAGGGKDPSKYMLSLQSPLEITENYAKLRMNLLYTLVGKNSKTVIVTSAVSGEGKSTIAANLAISCAMSGKKTLLVDGDMRRASQYEIFKIDGHAPGLSDVLAGRQKWIEAVIKDIRKDVDLLPGGHIPPNPSELLESENMDRLLKELQGAYDLVLIDLPPVNIVADPLTMSGRAAGCIFVVRQYYTDRREIRRALNAAELTGMPVLGFVFYGEKLSGGNYYGRRYYKKYYDKYDQRRRRDFALPADPEPLDPAPEAPSSSDSADQ